MDKTQTKENDKKIEKRSYRDSEAAIYLGISESYLRHARMYGGGRGPQFIKIGRTVRYLKEDLDAWLDSHAKKENTAYGSHSN